jgi:phage shock protein PspC (stress-responsive transcriptional regulator)
MIAPMEDGPSTAPSAPSPLGQAGDTPPRRRVLYREPEEKKIAGVCGGLADYTGLDPGLVRAAAVVLAVVAPFTIAAYLVAIFVIDERPASVPRVTAPPVEALERYGWLPIAVLVAGALIGFNDGWWLWFDVPLAAPILIGIGIWLLVRSRNEESPHGGSPRGGPAGGGASGGGAPGGGGPEGGEPGGGDPSEPEPRPRSGWTGEPFDSSVDGPRRVVDDLPQTPWSSSRDQNYLSLGVDITTGDGHIDPGLDRTTDVRSAADDADAGGFDPAPSVPGTADPRRTGSPPATVGAGPPSGLPPLTPPGWSGPEAGSLSSPSLSTAAGPADPGDHGGVTSGPAAWSVTTPDGSIRVADAVAARLDRDRTAVDGHDRPAESERLGLVVTSLLFVGGGTAWYLDTAGIADVDPRGVVAVGLLVVGAGLVLAAWRGRARAALIPLGFLGAGALMSGEIVDVPLDAGVGDRTVLVDQRSDIDEPVQLLAGDLVVDLRDAPLSTSRPTRVTAGVGVGEMQVRVPQDANVRVETDVRIGGVSGALAAGPDADGGVLMDETYVLDGEEGGPDIELVLDVGIGEAEVTRG